MSILDKKQMTEEDIKLNFITPVIKAKGWDGKITMETKITDGRINLKENTASKKTLKKAEKRSSRHISRQNFFRRRAV